MKSQRHRARPVRPLRLSFAAAACAVCFAGEALAQSPPDWQVEIARADAAYAEGLQALNEKRRLATLQAGETWFAAMEAEIAGAVRDDDVTLARGLKSKIVDARAGGRVPAERPAARATFARHEYALIDDAKTWIEAKAHCERMGGRLLVIDNPAEEAFVLGGWGASDFWVGASDLWSPGVYRNLDGKPFRSFAVRFRTDNLGDRQNCVGWFANDKKWDDFPDGKRMAYVCEWE